MPLFLYSEMNMGKGLYWETLMKESEENKMTNYYWNNEEQDINSLSELFAIYESLKKTNDIEDGNTFEIWVENTLTRWNGINDEIPSKCLDVIVDIEFDDEEKEFLSGTLKKTFYSDTEFYVWWKKINSEPNTRVELIQYH